MKCPHCGIDVEPGTMFCPECLTEIPWVPEYNTVETLMTKEEKKRREKSSKGESAQKRAASGLGRRKKGLLALGIVLLLAVILKVIWEVRAYNSFDYQYEHALEACDAQEYDRSLEYIERALELDDEDLQLNLLYARVLAGRGDAQSGVQMLFSLLKSDPANVEIYRTLIYIYEEQGQYEEIHRLLGDCEEEAVLTAFHDYLVSDPAASVDTGVYDEEQSVELSSEEDAAIYYTLDGTDPTAESTEYTGPIRLQEGVTELKAVCINEKSIPSDVIYRKYTVIIEPPDAPEISPEEGTYSAATEITMEIPEGCKGYYAFDVSQVSTANEEYTGPVEMPEGTHTFCAIVVAANGKESDTVSREYTYDPDSAPEEAAGTDPAETETAETENGPEGGA